MTSSWNKQIENRNFLSPIGFKFLLAKYPKVAYFCQSANIPAINVAIQQQSTPLRYLPYEGFTSYDPLTLSFLIDEDLENYMIMHNWLRALGTPDNVRESTEFREKMQAIFKDDNLFADGTLTVLNSNFKSNFNVVFFDLIPTSLSALEFNATIDGTEYAMASVTFQYSGYQVRSGESTQRDKRLT